MLSKHTRTIKGIQSLIFAEPDANLHAVIGVEDRGNGREAGDIAGYARHEVLERGGIHDHDEAAIVKLRGYPTRFCLTLEGKGDGATADSVCARSDALGALLDGEVLLFIEGDSEIALLYAHLGEICLQFLLY